MSRISLLTYYGLEGLGNLEVESHDEDEEVEMHVKLLRKSVSHTRHFPGPGWSCHTFWQGTVSGRVRISTN